MRHVALALAALALVLAAAGCGTSNTPTPSQDQLKSALSQHGIEVCNRGTAKSHFHGAGTAQWYALSHDCSSSSRETLIGVIPFEKKSDRNAAFRETLYGVGSRRVPNNIVAMTFKDSLVVMAHIRNRPLLQQVISKLKTLGAK